MLSGPAAGLAALAEPRTSTSGMVSDPDPNHIPTRFCKQSRLCQTLFAKCCTSFLEWHQGAALCRHVPEYSLIPRPSII